MINKNLSTSHLKTLPVFLILGYLAFASHASHYPQEQVDSSLKALYLGLNNIQNLDMSTRLDKISEKFLGKPYILGSLGEGKGGRYDQSPLYRADGFDCETLVTTVLAIALANNQNNFKQCINKLRYANSKPRFTERHHFTDLDWNQSNQKHGFVKDITTTFTDAKNRPVAKIAVALIDKPSWYQHFDGSHIKLQASPKQQEQRLTELKERGSKLTRRVSKIAYIPFSALFDKNGNPNQHLFAQIPNASIIEIIRPNWNLEKEIGTHLNVSHLGFAFWKNKQLIFRQASSQYGKVVDVPLVDYLKEALSSPTIKGINVQVIFPKDCLSAPLSSETGGSS